MAVDTNATQCVRSQRPDKGPIRGEEWGQPDARLSPCDLSEEGYIEFMLYETPPSIDRLRTMHNICLEVPDVAEAGAILQTRRNPPGSKPPTELKVGVNGKRQINYYDRSVRQLRSKRLRPYH